MDPTYCKISQIMPTFAFFLLLMISSVFPVHSNDYNQANRTLSPSEKSDMITALLEKINKPYVKTIQSPDGDVIDCVPTHLQPAFDHPLLKGKKPLDPPERPKGVNRNVTVAEISQLWSSSGESCPEGTIPIRRTTEEDVLRASSIERFGRKNRTARYSSSDQNSEYAISFTYGEYYGATAIINVWQPLVAINNIEFSLAQMWLTAGPAADVNTIEAGWQVYPEMYNDSNPRFFIYWTRDAYQTTGCYNLLCEGFVQIDNSVAIGGALYPLSSDGGTQYVIDILIWKDAEGNWWLDFDSTVLGYWPPHLFTYLKYYSDDLQFGGEIVNTEPDGSHTSTQMGSGRFAEEGFGHAAYFNNIQVLPDIYWDRFPNLQFLATNPFCYDILPGIDPNNWGTYFFFGGPGGGVAICP